jgi:hypothetical protein
MVSRIYGAGFLNACKQNETLKLYGNPARIQSGVFFGLVLSRWN